ncbi:CoA transferase [Streptomyces durbertensis]|uniref:CoA transferase n=1 Tax=Streptomyces durbertensis TaxID=2448886 RepID=A0ABR6EI41_9ACTN|nr:CaiB/BaiF CoA-transferase family protein [Streptomyces durbertensis]MBB1244977.1 CoA transferase [Streptomyces durbertensis]
MAAEAEPVGPLAGVRVVELAGIGPGPFAAMLLADLGADVVRVDRPGGAGIGINPAFDVTNRNKRSVLVDLKTTGPGPVLEMAERADVLIEGFRPGVAERLGVGPEECLARNPRLVYGRMTGWGQEGPLSDRAGHDIDYVAVTGSLSVIGPADGPPVIPANLLGDFAGGSMYLVTGVLAALHHARAHGRGQVVDAAIVDGTSHLSALLHGMLRAGAWQDRRGVNPLDGSYPFYGVYETADGGHLAVGALESKFYEEFLDRLGLTEARPADGPETSADTLGDDPDTVPPRDDPARWPLLRERIAARVRTRTRDEWARHFADSDACVAPVLSLREAPHHPHLAARGTFVEHAGTVQPAPAPRFSDTPTAVRSAPARPGEHHAEVAREWGLTSLPAAAEPPDRPEPRPDRPQPRKARP